MSEVLQYSHTLVFITAFLEEVQLCLIPHEQLMTAITNVDSCRVGLVAVAQRDAVKIAAEQQRHGVRRAIRHTCIHHLFIVSVLQTSRQLPFVGHAIANAEDRCMYC